MHPWHFRFTTAAADRGTLEHAFAREIGLRLVVGVVCRSLSASPESSRHEETAAWLGRYLYIHIIS
jgi:hypothetical protein